MDNKFFARVAGVLIWIIALFGLGGTFSLAQEEFNKGDICPTIAGVPACYIILFCLLLILSSQTHLLKDKNWLYWLGAGVAFTIALIATVGQMMGWWECPKTAGGTPMCYLSLGLFSSLIVLKAIEIKFKKLISVT